MRLYVIWTLRFFFHIGRVECVTFHVPSSQLSLGGVMGSCGWVVMPELDGARRVMGDMDRESEELHRAMWDVCAFFC